MHRSILERPYRRASRMGIAVLGAWFAMGCAATAQDAPKTELTPAPEGAKAYFITPTDGATVSSPVEIRFGLSGMGVAPAGVINSKTGHHHLIIDAPTPEPGAPIPSDANHRHFGGGQTEVSIELEPGSHTLQLVVGDHTHIPHDQPVVSEKITITVE